ncbi:MAG: hypothetical protein M3P91_11390 [Actinomycetota bacterium]|nr:hypothetical protein [Actinomycetota bacterium]
MTQQEPPSGSNRPAPPPGLEPDPESPELPPPSEEGSGGAGGSLRNMGGDIGGVPDVGAGAPGEPRPLLADPVPPGVSGDRPTLATDRQIDPGAPVGQGADGLTDERRHQKDAGGP